ncbi:MAG: C4-dicarboxylate ABC transporter [Acidobacteria bacterium]|nr:C4-dicarboxylate ABC transporter [Acidobacteriota bacterium]
MNLAWISVGALILVVTLSCVTSINVGVLAMAMALIVGVFLGDMKVAQIVEGFPTDLFITLVGVTLLFAIAECNGTLARLTAKATRLCRGHAGVLPILFFVIGFILATIGAGATPASALLAPAAMAVAARAGVPPLLMVIMTGNGALAGTLSPFAPTGIVAHGVMARIGLGGVEWQTFAYNALAHTLVGFGGFLLLGGWKLFVHHDKSVKVEEQDAGAMETRHWLTTIAIVVLIATVAGLKLHVGMMGLILSAALILLRTVEESKAIQRMPWGVILMVTGVTVLIALMQEVQGLALITSFIANVSTPGSVEAVVAFGTGIVSVYSSTSGVVLPAFLPMVPDLAHKLGGIPPLSIAWSMNVGSSLVDLSSLSTVGALYIAGAAPGTDVRKLFNGLLVWGLSMSVVGAVLCWILFG